MTWRQFIRDVEHALSSHSIDPKKDIIHIDFIDISGITKVVLSIDTSKMPKSCTIQIEDAEPISE